MKPLKQVEHSLHDLTSPRRGYTFGFLLVTLLVAGVLLWLKHGTWLSHPNEVMLTVGPDGFKNYMASAWHVRYDSSFVHYSGMNYPYGDHVLFTDNQPIISSSLQWWDRAIAPISDQTVGILNIIQVLSLMLGCGVLFLFFRKLHLPVGYAMAGALVLTFLAPQYNRFTAHFGLSHTFVIPMLLYWLCRYEERESRRYQSLHIAFLVWFAAQLHFYYFGMAALFLTLYTGFQILRQFNRKNIFRRMSHWIVMVIVPFVLLNVWLHWSDYAPDRAASPYGFTTYIGYWEGVFLPYDFMPLHQWINHTFVPIRELDGESKAYAGIIALFYTLWLLFSGFKMFGKNWEDAAYHRTHKHYLRGIFFAAFALLLFACGFPFAIKGMDWMVDYMGPLRQFRGLGRFTWVYYYVINTLIFYGAWNWGRRFTGFGKKQRLPRFKYVIMAFPLVILAMEAYSFQSNKPVETSPNATQKAVLQQQKHHWIGKVDLSDCQAILPLPYYHIGSENVWKEFNYDHYRFITEMAHQTGLPDMGVNMSRTPIGDMVKSLQLVLEPGEIPAILADLPDNRPIVIVSLASLWENTVRDYPHLLEKAHIVYEDGEVKILKILPDQLRNHAEEFSQAIHREIQNAALTPVPGTHWLTSTPHPEIHTVSFDELTTTKFHFQGTGAFSGLMSEPATLWSGALPKGRYNFTVWMKVNQDMGANHELHVVENAQSDGHEIHHQHEGLRFYIKSIVNGWGLFSVDVESYEGGNMHFFLLKKGVNTPFYADEVVIKPAGVTLYRQEAGWVVRDNFWYRHE